MTVNLNLIVVCGFTGCPWSMAIDPDAGADPMAVHEAYLEHLDDHDPDGTDCEAPEHWVSLAQKIHGCSSCHAAPGQPHTDYCTLPRWAAHDAEVARALAANHGLYAGDSPEQIAAEQARIDRFMAGGQDQ